MLLVVAGFRPATHRALWWGLSTTSLFSVMSMTQCSAWMAIPHSWISWDFAEPTRVCSWTLERACHACTATVNANYCRCRTDADVRRRLVCMCYLQVVDEQLVKGRVSVEVDQEALVIYYSNARGLQRNAQTFQLLLSCLDETWCIFNAHIEHW